MQPQQAKSLKRWALALAIAVLGTYFCLEIAEHLFASYYREQWGISARILHSPPFGTNYIEKLAIVKIGAALIGFILSFGVGFWLSKRLFCRTSTS